MLGGRRSVVPQALRAVLGGWRSVVPTSLENSAGRVEWCSNKPREQCWEGRGVVTLRASLSGTFLQRKDVKQCLESEESGVPISPDSRCWEGRGVLSQQAQRTRLTGVPPKPKQWTVLERWTPRAFHRPTEQPESLLGMCCH